MGMITHLASLVQFCPWPPIIFMYFGWLSGWPFAFLEGRCIESPRVGIGAVRGLAKGKLKLGSSSLPSRTRLRGQALPSFANS